DDPKLDCRLPGLEQHSPFRMLVDSKLRIPATSHFALTAKDRPTYIFTTEKSDAAKKDTLTDRGIKIFQVPCSEDGHVSMQRCLELMAEEGITTVLVEAGGYLASGLVKSNLVDKLVIYRAPMIIGGDGIAAWHPLGVEQLRMSKRFTIRNIERIGPDIIETYNRCTEAL
ncbi:MAG: RibD family protein, partial [Pseudomonadota bacterium]|nr:RibD family protein [Pseudomonadota bacterium]